MLRLQRRALLNTYSSKFVFVVMLFDYKVSMAWVLEVRSIC